MIIIPLFIIVVPYYYYCIILSNRFHYNKRYYYYVESFPLLSRTTTNLVLWNHNNNGVNNNNKNRKIDPIVVLLKMNHYKSNENTIDDNSEPKDVCTNEIDAKTKATIVRFITNPMCPYAHKVWLALECSKTLYQYKEISLYGTNGKPSWFLKLNPSGTIPVIVVIDDDDNNNKVTTNVKKKDNSNNNDRRMMIYPDSDLILDQFYQNAKPSWEYCIPLVPPPSDHYNDDDIIQSIKEWRNFINEQLIPIGKQYVLYPNQNNNKQQFISLLCDTNHRILNMKQKTTIVTSLSPSSDSTNTISTPSRSTIESKYILSSIYNYHDPTIVDCHAFPFVYRLYTRYGNDIMKQYAPHVVEWIEFCMKQSSFQKTIVSSSSWWWWWY